MESQNVDRPVHCIVKLGGAAITMKNSFETLNEEDLLLTSKHLREAIMAAPSCKTPLLDCADATEEIGEGGLEPACRAAFIVVHGAGSFGHFQASSSGVNKGGLRRALVTAGFVATRVSVTKLNHIVVRALAAEGIPAVGISPFAAGWSTSKKSLDRDNVTEVRRACNVGLLPVLHGDAVLDSQQGCSILSGDVIIRRLAEAFQPNYVVFLTNVSGVFDRPPTEANAVLLNEIVVDESGDWIVVKPKLESSVTTAASNHDTTGGMATKISEAASIARLGINVYIVKAGTRDALQALMGNVRDTSTKHWVGTIVRSAYREL
ncbi:hypothetical protein O6H91_09G048800 [Diphasiastrum complanatum]|uniref:Uncharacterized protein n=1 Tax=Diphasiastrum complanatum TaxID=34168 RepID=A0ACC2CP18_DIPCM|nr:hypothetical protein O6H91_09G048800 [Diphasiastrum complanatum]